MTTAPRGAGAALSVVGRGARDSVAVAVAYLPFGLALGATLGSSHLPALLAWSTSPLLVGGAAQLLAVQLLSAGGKASACGGRLIVNLPDAALRRGPGPHAAAWPRWRWLGATCWPIRSMRSPRPASAARRGRPARHRLLYYLGVGVALDGMAGHDRGRGAARRGAAHPLHQLAAPRRSCSCCPMLTHRAPCGSAVAGGVVAVAASGLPLGLGLLVGAGAGIAVGGALAGRHG